MGTIMPRLVTLVSIFLDSIMLQLAYLVSISLIPFYYYFYCLFAGFKVDYQVHALLGYQNAATPNLTVSRAGRDDPGNHCPKCFVLEEAKSVYIISRVTSPKQNISSSS